MKPSLAVAIMLAAWGGTPASGQAPPEPAAVELAPYMGTLQTLTHKLSLSVAHDNPELAAFYLYESQEQLETIKEQVPEYRGQPIALLIDRLITPQFAPLAQAIEAGQAADTAAALARLIDSCNACHRASGHAFIRITNRSDINPFNQDFAPQP